MIPTWYKAVGWCFVLMCPFVGGNLLAVMSLHGLGLISHDTGIHAMIASSVVWLLLYMAWFDGSKLQKSLI